MPKEVAFITTASDLSAEWQAAPRALPGSTPLPILPAPVSIQFDYSRCLGRGPRLDWHRAPQTTRQGAWLTHGPTAGKLMCNRNSSPAKVHRTGCSSTAIRGGGVQRGRPGRRVGPCSRSPRGRRPEAAEPLGSTFRRLPLAPEPHRLPWQRLGWTPVSSHWLGNLHVFPVRAFMCFSVQWGRQQLCRVSARIQLGLVFARQGDSSALGPESAGSAFLT